MISLTYHNWISWVQEVLILLVRRAKEVAIQTLRTLFFSHDGDRKNLCWSAAPSWLWLKMEVFVEGTGQQQMGYSPEVLPGLERLQFSRTQRITENAGETVKFPAWYIYLVNGLRNIGFQREEKGQMSCCFSNVTCTETEVVEPSRDATYWPNTA